MLGYRRTNVGGDVSMEHPATAGRSTSRHSYRKSLAKVYLGVCAPEQSVSLQTLETHTKTLRTDEVVVANEPKCPRHLSSAE